MLLKEETTTDDIVVLSCEGWISEAASECAAVFSEMEVPTELFMVVRPPIDLLNSAWWQWGAWVGIGIDEWISSEWLMASTLPHLDTWERYGTVTRTRIVDLSQDPIVQLLKFIGFGHDEIKGVVRSPRLNKSTNIDLLVHLINNREVYGRTVHDPSIELRLKTLLDLPSRAPPLVIPRDTIPIIIKRLAEENRRLIKTIYSEETTLSDETIRKYIDPNYYDSACFVDYNKLISQGNSDEFVRELLNHTIRMGDKFSAIANHLDRIQMEMREL